MFALGMSRVAPDVTDLGSVQSREGGFSQGTGTGLRLSVQDVLLNPELVRSGLQNQVFRNCEIMFLQVHYPNFDNLILDIT